MHIINEPVNPHNQQNHILASPPISCYIINLTHDQSVPAEDEADDRAMPYSDVPCSDSAVAADLRLELVGQWLQTLKQPEGQTDSEYKTFMRYCTEFFLGEDDQLWRKDTKGAHKIVIPQERRIFLLTSAHNDVGHHGFYTTNALLAEQYWWPAMGQDVTWFISTCHLCQLRKTQQISIPPIVATPALLFAKAYIDMMHLTPSGGFKYIVQARCSLTHWPEWEMLRQESARLLAWFILNNIIYCWGTLLEIVTDNRAPFVKAMDYLTQHYHIKHIHISSYNSRANGIVEWSHFDVWQALFKACNGEQRKWSVSAYSVFWAKRVSI